MEYLKHIGSKGRINEPLYIAWEAIKARTSEDTREHLFYKFPHRSECRWIWDQLFILNEFVP